MSNKINHFIDALGNPFVFDLNDESLPAWSYAILGIPGSGMSVSTDILTSEEIFQRKIAKENELFDHFISTGQVKS